jgi:molybdopterin converting factor small subunit
LPTVWIPSLLRELTGGQSTVEVPGATVREVVDALDAAYPGVKARVCDGDQLRPSIRVAVDGTVSRRGLRQPVGERSEVAFVPAVGGGSAV